MDTSSVAEPTAWIGIDVSKDVLDACLLRRTGKAHFQSVANTDAGHAKLLRWVQHLAPSEIAHFCMESTGTYGQACAEFLVAAHQRVSVVNPARIKYARLAQGEVNKTDKAEARVIALYCQKENPPPWRLAAPEVQTLIALVRRLQSVQELLQQEKNRLAQPSLLAPIKQSLEQTITFLESEVVRLQEQIREHCDNTPSLKADVDLLQSIPGIGEVTARKILAELPDVSLFASAQSAAAYAGLCPQEYRSGRSVHSRPGFPGVGTRH